MEERKGRRCLKICFWTSACTLAGASLIALAYSFFIVPTKLGPPPDGWTVIGGTNVERMSLVPRETRRIRCDKVDDRFCHIERPGCYAIYVMTTNTTELVKQLYNLEPNIDIDVPDDKPIWAELCEHANDKKEEAFSDFRLHVHTNHAAAGISNRRPNAETALEFGHR